MTNGEKRQSYTFYNDLYKSSNPIMILFNCTTTSFGPTTFKLSPNDKHQPKNVGLNCTNDLKRTLLPSSLASSTSSPKTSNITSSKLLSAINSTSSLVLLLGTFRRAFSCGVLYLSARPYMRL